MRLAFVSSFAVALMLLGGCPSPEETSPTERDQTTTPTQRPTDQDTQQQREQQQQQEQQQQDQQQPGDQEIRQQLTQEIQQDQLLSQQARNVTVEVSNGVVTLRGQVQSDAEKQRLEQLANDMDGVEQVESDELEVSSGSPGQSQPGMQDPQEPS